jgi:hypothetical protein
MSTPQGGTPRLDMLLSRLVLLGGDVHDLLATGDWEGAQLHQASYDEAFAQLQRLIETGHVFEPRHEQVLGQLRSVHQANEQLMRDLAQHAQSQLSTVKAAQHVRQAYSPLGARHRPSPRYIDGAA